MGGDTGTRRPDDGPRRASIATILREWGRLRCVGVGGPPAHIALLRELCVDRRGGLRAHEFEDAIAACNLLPGPASTQLAIFCAWRVRGAAGAVAGGLGFVVPGLVVMVALATLFLAGDPPAWVRGAGAGAGAAVAAVAVHAAAALMPGSLRRARGDARIRWAAYVAVGAAAAATVGAWLVVLLAASGAGGVGRRRAGAARRPRGAAQVCAWPALAAAAPAAGGLGALAWLALQGRGPSAGRGLGDVPPLH